MEPADYEQHLASEREYLRALKTEPSETVETVTYMEALTKLETAAYVTCILNINFFLTLP
jgi:hypothetical protein